MSPRRRWRQLRYRLLLRRMAGPRVLRSFAEAYPEAFFVEIGANDGETHDQLRPHILGGRWRGVMVEPVSFIFERLRRNYGHIDGIAFENAAVGASDGELPFYHLRDATPDERAGLPEWYDGLGSLSRELILAHAPQIPDVEERIRETRVPVLSYSSLLEKHGQARPDLVLVDAEGHDWEIVRTIDLASQGPRLLVFEHFHLTPGDRAAARRRLEQAGYFTLEEGFDTFCLRAGDDELTRRFRSLRAAVPPVSKAEEAG